MGHFHGIDLITGEGGGVGSDGDFEDSGGRWVGFYFYIRFELPVGSCDHSFGWLDIELLWVIGAFPCSKRD